MADGSPSRLGDSRTEVQSYSTARRIGKVYQHEPADSDNPNKSSDRGDDGYVSSHGYAIRSRLQRAEQAVASLESSGLQGDARPAGRRCVGVDYHHPLEDWLARRSVRWFLRLVSKQRAGRKSILEEIIHSYANPAAPRWQRAKYFLVHKFIDRMRGSVPAETFRKRVAEHAATVRGLVLTARSVGEFGLTVPQRFSGPLFAVWNFTNQCNLSCKHCYQDAERHRLPDELTLSQKLDLVDQMGEQYVAMIAFSGGEPTISPDLFAVLRRCQRYDIHTTIATHGGTLSAKLAAELAEAGVKYVEISLDSVYPERHDAFRGQPGMWHRTVRGMRAVVEQPGLRLGVAMCVHQGNFHELEDMLQFCVDVGASCFAHFNFIPVGRGLEMTEGDLNPAQREWLLRRLNEWMQSGKLGILSTSPQFGRVCVAYAPVDGGRVATSHVGGAGGEKARVVAKYLGGCGAGRTYVAIEPNGDITPCVYLPHRVLGNVGQRPFIEIFRNNCFWDLLCDREQLLHHCQVCEFKHYCGGCRARADAYFGQLNAGDPGCLFNERHWDGLVAGGLARDSCEAGEEWGSPAGARRAPAEREVLAR